MKLKRHLRTVLEAAAHRTGLLAHFERRAHEGLTILTYHRVLDPSQCADYPLPTLAMPEDAFRQQMTWLARHFEVLPVGEALARQSAGARGERPLASVTFDDGYVDNVEIAAPILESLGLRATFFVVTEFVSSGNDLWFDRATRLIGELREDHDPWTTLEHLKRMDSVARERLLADWTARTSDAGALQRVASDRSSMTRSHLEALLRSGHEIGSHTLNHSILVHLGDEELEREVAGSKLELESWLGVPVHGFTYPNGDNDERVRLCARRAGYRWACTTAEGRNIPPADPLALQRIDVTPSRVSDHAGTYTEIAFRSEISLMRSALRGSQ